MKERDYTYKLILQQEKMKKVKTDDQLDMAEKWQNGQITNFDYLLYLNFRADRSFNDLTQYVFEL